MQPGFTGSDEKVEGMLHSGLHKTPLASNNLSKALHMGEKGSFYACCSGHQTDYLYAFATFQVSVYHIVELLIGERSLGWIGTKISGKNKKILHKETLNLSTDADRNTNTIFFGGGGL